MALDREISFPLDYPKPLDSQVLETRVGNPFSFLSRAAPVCLPRRCFNLGSSNLFYESVQPALILSFIFQLIANVQMIDTHLDFWQNRLSGIAVVCYSVLVVYNNVMVHGEPTAYPSPVSNYRASYTLSILSLSLPILAVRGLPFCTFLMYTFTVHTCTIEIHTYTRVTIVELVGLWELGSGSYGRERGQRRHYANVLASETDGLT